MHSTSQPRRTSRAARKAKTKLRKVVLTPRLLAYHAPPNVLLSRPMNHGVVGYTAVHPEDGEMFLLFVHPAHAGHGIGRTLLAAARDALRAR